MIEIGEIVRMLGQRAEGLARELLPRGKREGREWVCKDAPGFGGKVTVCVDGAKAGMFLDTGRMAGGDALDLVAIVACHGDKAEALRWARGWLGLGPATAGERRARSVRAPPPRDVEREQREAEDKRQKGRGLWAAGVPIAGTPAEAYLAGRGISLEALGRAPRVLRFNPRTWCAERGGEHPAMVALIQEFGRTIGAHRTYLAADGRGKARVKAAKKVLGQHKGGLIPLWRGASDLPLKDAPAGDVVAIAEGIEDGLTIALHCPEWRVVACISVGNMAELVLPPAISEVRLIFDRDGENPACAAARERAVERYQREGRRVFEVRPPEGFKDFNDWHMADLRGRRGAA